MAKASPREPAAACLPAALLADRVPQIEADRSGFLAVRLQVPAMAPADGWPWTTLIVEEALAPLGGLGETALYGLGDGDFCLVCRDLPLSAVETAVTRIAQTIHDLRVSGRDPTADGDITATWLDLAADDDLALLAGIAAAAARPRPPTAAREGLRPLAAADLPAITGSLGSGNLGALIRRQSVLTMQAAHDFRPLFDEVFVSIADCQRVFAAGIDLTARPALFRYLTESLDQGVLAELIDGRAFAAPGRPYSLNLNLSTLEMPLFERFRSALGPGHGLLVEVQVDDVLAHLEAFLAVRDRLRRQGFRVVLDGLTLAGLDVLDPAAVDADFVKVLFRPGEAGGARLTRLAPALARIGLDRLIFARVEREETVKQALGLGVSRFQGRFIDKLVQAMAGRGLLRACPG
jgi:EAL domain-containing protein (putative c-di-GMP-specific phosphodiesterase class I)